MKLVILSLMFLIAMPMFAASNGQETTAKGINTQEARIKAELEKRLNTAIIYLLASNFNDPSYLAKYKSLVKDSEGDLSVKALRKALNDASDLLENAHFINPRQAVLCSLEDFQNGACFAPSCTPCILDKPGPLGTGLLCRKVKSSESLQPCCVVGGGAPCEVFDDHSRLKNSELFE
ncbi:hypothetical protein L1077_20475 [Pseudoalteromonas luteoviolacea]|uniref:hypothetical protein n=1 Tax=Pseudoalteromonas luteoviolacea TaxID=43657 RepID=UPI001F2BF93E|nr:hypothetical protein [Pseudoalteromonas luteoviolacea]MCF6441816.1 hypothetical protein [Pseudoalteromonas luteoviolacea]